MNCSEKLTFSVIFISLIIFNISFWIDHWSTSENSSQGIWNLCFNADNNSCCQSFSDRGEETPDWFNHFKRAVYAACISITLTCLIVPYCAMLNEKDIKGKECVTVLLIVACFSSATCLIIALRVYGFNFKSVESLEDHNLHTSFWISVICVFLYSFAGILITGTTVMRNGYARALCSTYYNLMCCYVCRKRLETSTDGIHNSNPRNPAPNDDSALNDICRQPPHLTLPPRRNLGFKGKWHRIVGSDNLLIVPLQRYSSEYNEIETSFLQNNDGFQIKEMIMNHKFKKYARKLRYHCWWTFHPRGYQQTSSHHFGGDVFRIQNSRLYDAHMSFEKHFMETARQLFPHSYRQYLWHGTSEDCTENINKYGFNRNYLGKNACLYGDGVYFARDPAYSSRNTYSVPGENGDKCLYKCSVFVGRYGKGKQHLKEPPKDIYGVRYDSTVDDLIDAKIHVIFQDYQAYPEYLIKFNCARY